MGERESLLEAVAREEARLSALREKAGLAQKRLTDLRARLAEIDAGARPESTSVFSTPRTAAQKVTLFRSLFRGRTDVYPKRWENAKTGRSGYAPACANEWITGVCEKKKKIAPGSRGSRCASCPNQAFLSVDDSVIHDHLSGHRTLGVYPLLKDETCFFLAADFDKKTWQDDVSAFLETCRILEVPVALERSRSGNGAHAWFFFTAPVQAKIVRKMGCYLLTETMARHPKLSLDSYDRFFPNQDTLPRGGFGNLIALPLQLEPREEGNSVFIDELFRPFHDQWAFLESIQRIPPDRVTSLANEATRLGRVIGVRLYAGKGNETPATGSSPRPMAGPVMGPLPDAVESILSHKLIVEKAGLPPALLERIKRLAAFQNPEFYRRQGMRLSTARTPRIISCAEDLPHHILLPRGCRTELEILLEEHDVALKVQDRREEGANMDVSFRGTLTRTQANAAKAMLSHDIGIFVAPPGVGKTVLGIHLIAERRRNTLILVHRQPLADQWQNQLSMFLGIKAGSIGRLGGGKRKLNGALDIAMIQSLVRRDRVDNLVAGYGHVIVDECHHVPAVSFERVLSAVRARYLTGLTATPRRRDGHQPITEMQLGPVRDSVDPRSQSAERPFEHVLRIRETGFCIPDGSKEPTIQGLYSLLIQDDDRNRLIMDDLLVALEEGRSPLLLTERREHLEFFARNLVGCVRNLIVLHGGMKAEERREAASRLAGTPDDKERLVLATGRFIGEGFDDARLDTLFLALPISWKGTLVQYAGRLHRLHPDKTEVRIYDYVDRNVSVLSRMFERRIRGYRAIGYRVDDGDEDRDDGPGETRIEWDENALRFLEEAYE
jgi:superfamily II DNA or RNA helicase